MLKGNSLLPDTQTGDPQQQFELLDMLGQGAYGSVSKALHKSSGKLFAVKILSATSLSQINAIKKQIQILKLCDNQHIVKYYGSYFKDNNLWIILQYCQAGSIIDLLNITQLALNEHQIASILESVLKGLVYLHANKKIHRDIKAANILLNTQGVAKLADFGVSTQSLYTNAGHRSQVGSPYWMSPEVMKHNEYTNKTDIWSLGVTAIELAEGKAPNSHLKPLIAMWQLKDKPIQALNKPANWSEEFNSFVRECLNINPTMRPQAKALLSHEFIQKYSKGQPLIAQLVQTSLSDIQEFRMGQENSDESDGDLIDMLNGQAFEGNTKTIVNNRTQRSKMSQGWSQKQGWESRQGSEVIQMDSSMVVKEIDGGSMIVNDQESSMIAVQGEKDAHAEKQQTGSHFLSNYISGLKSTNNQMEQQRQQLKKKISEYDTTCLKQLEQTFTRHKNTINSLINSGGQQFFGMNTEFINKEIQSKLFKAQNIKEFVNGFSRYQQAKGFQRSTCKPKSQFSQKAHHSTQTNDPASNQFANYRDNIPRGVKSQEFPQFKSSEKQHYFNSKSIISDMENVKGSRDIGDDLLRFKNQKFAKRFIVTQPQEWLPADRRPFGSGDASIQGSDKTRLKEQFFLDPDVKSSLMKHMNSIQRMQQTIIEPNTVKYDRVAQSTLFHDIQQQGLKHQNSMVTIGRRKQLFDCYEGQYLMGEQEDDANINIFQSRVPSHKNSKQLQGRKQKKKMKRGVSSQKRGNNKGGAFLRKLNK